jgi:hypothetical protein
MKYVPDSAAARHRETNDERKLLIMNYPAAELRGILLINIFRVDLDVKVLFCMEVVFFGSTDYSTLR